MLQSTGPSTVQIKARAAEGSHSGISGRYGNPGLWDGLKRCRLARYYQEAAYQEAANERCSAGMSSLFSRHGADLNGCVERGKGCSRSRSRSESRSPLGTPLSTIYDRTPRPIFFRRPDGTSHGYMGSNVEFACFCFGRRNYMRNYEGYPPNKKEIDLDL